MSLRYLAFDPVADRHSCLHRSRYKRCMHPWPPTLHSPDVRSSGDDDRPVYRCSDLRTGQAAYRILFRVAPCFVQEDGERCHCDSHIPKRSTPLWASLSQ